MCGITGLINCGNIEILRKMNNVLAHRGPDDMGEKWFAKNNSGIGHRRLSVIDLSELAHQPMQNENGNLWITYNGEIYNFQEIRQDLIKCGYHFKSQSDTEVLIKAYEEWGIECLNKLNGMFVFAIYDCESNKLFAARDRIGIKPFYYYHNNSSFIFSSEIKAILSTGLTRCTPDFYSLYTPTRYQIAPNTGFENIYKLQQGHYLIFENGNLKIDSYWNIDIHEDDIKSESDVIDELDFLLTSSVKMQMISDVPVGLLLSGGLDSSIICALMRKNTNNDLHAFTIKFSDEDQKYEKMVEDYLYARKIAKQFNFIYHEIEIHPQIVELLPQIIWHMDEPLADPASINTFLISKAARELGMVVLLNGMGGDEIFGGYRKHLACLKAEVYQNLVPPIIRKKLPNILNRFPVSMKSQGLKYLRWIKRYVAFANLPEAKRFMASDMSLTEYQFNLMFDNIINYEDTHFYKTKITDFQVNDITYLSKMCLNDVRHFLAEHNLLYSDKTSMMASIEGRPPLTDHRIVEYMFSISPKYKINRTIQKYILKKVSEKYLPKNIIYRQKGGFSAPIRAWVKGPLESMISDLLSEESLKKRGLYNTRYISQLINNDKNGIEDNAYIIWWLLTNELWFRTFFN